MNEQRADSLSISPSSSRQRRWPMRLAVGLLVCLSAVVVVALSTYWFGEVSGEEFSPHTFQRRSYFYYEIPLLRLQAQPIVRRDTTRSFEKFLVSKRFVIRDNSTEPRWDLVDCLRAPAHLVEGDAAILCHYLDAQDANGDSYWREWTEKNQDRAKILWPAVADAARQQLYTLVPELAHLARDAGDGAPLQLATERTLIAGYQRTAEARQELADHAAAVRLYSAALKYDPSEAKLLRGRAKSLQALGQPQKAEEDLARAARSSDAL